MQDFSDSITGPGFAECYVKPKKDPTAFRWRCLFVALNVVLDLIFIAICLILPIFFVGALLLGVPGWILGLRFGATEYEYTLAGDELTLSVLHGSLRKRLLTAPVRGISRVAPDTEEFAAEIEKFAPEEVFSALSHPDSPDRWFALLTREDGVRTLFCFDMTPKLFRALRHVRPGAVKGVFHETTD